MLVVRVGRSTSVRHSRTHVCVNEREGGDVPRALFLVSERKRARQRVRERNRKRERERERETKVEL